MENILKDKYFEGPIIKINVTTQEQLSSNSRYGIYPGSDYGCGANCVCIR